MTGISLDQPECRQAELGFEALTISVGHSGPPSNVERRRCWQVRSVRLADVPDGVSHRAFVDVAGGTRTDSYTAAIAHAETGPDGERVVVLDALYETRPPFDPLAITAEVVALLKRYGVTSATSDRYAGAWVSEAFARHGVVVSQDAEPKSALYLATLPLLTCSGRSR